MKRLIQTFFKLVEIDSETGYEKEVVLFIKNWLKENLELKSLIDNYNNLFAVYKGGKNKSLLLNAHTDTVAPGKSIKPILKKNTIFSLSETILGADNKASLAVILEILLVCRENNITVPNIEILFTAHEESENIGAYNFNYSLLKSTEGFCFDMSKQPGSISIASPYYIRFDVSVTGKEAHASVPEKGESVILYLSEVLSLIKLGRIDNCLVNIGKINGGDVRNTIMGHAVLEGEIRSFYKESIYNKLENLKEIFNNNKQFKIKFDCLKENDGYCLNENNSLLCYCKNIIQTAGLNLEFIEHGGCSDVNIFREKGLNIINLGNGVKNAHSKDENISLANFEKLFNLILLLITKY